MPQAFSPAPTRHRVRRRGLICSYLREARRPYGRRAVAESHIHDHAAWLTIALIRCTADTHRSHTIARS
jgi:hypothetical protein